MTGSISAEEMMARPTKLTSEVQQRLVSAIASGNYLEPACAYAGIDYSTFRRWIERGEQAERGLYREFRDAIRRAEAEAEIRVVAHWQRQVPESWQASRDFLARRFPDRWGPKDRLEHGGQIDLAIR